MKSVGDMLPISTALGFRPDQSMDEGWPSLTSSPRRAMQGPNVVGSCSAPSTCRTTSSTRTALRWARATHPTPLSRRHRCVVPTRDPELYYTPSTRPGGRLPHVAAGRTDSVSTLDICSSEI